MPVQLNLDTATPATRLLEKQRQMNEIQDALTLQKDDYAKKEETFKRREEQLRKKDMELQESLIKFNKFLKENETKRLRAQKKAEDEEKAKQEKISLIEKEKAMLQQVKIQKQQLEKQLSQNKRYLKYLEAVKETNETEFPEIEYIVRRYNILVSELDSSQAHQNELNLQIEKVQREYQQFTKEQVNHNLGIGTESAHLLKKLEKAEAEFTLLENSLDSNLKNVSDRTSTISRIVMAIENIYLRCKSESRVLEHGINFATVSKEKLDEFNKAEAIARLDTVGDYISDYIAIVKGYDNYKKEARSFKSKNKAPNSATSNSIILVTNIENVSSGNHHVISKSKLQSSKPRDDSSSALSGVQDYDASTN